VDLSFHLHSLVGYSRDQPMQTNLPELTDKEIFLISRSQECFYGGETEMVFFRRSENVEQFLQECCLPSISASSSKLSSSILDEPNIKSSSVCLHFPPLTQLPSRFGRSASRLWNVDPADRLYQKVETACHALLVFAAFGAVLSSLWIILC
jgi:hypothetical protein